VARWRRILLWPLVRLVRVWGRTLRFDISPEEIAIYSRCDVPVAFVLWHNRLFLASEIHRRYRAQRPLYALISASKDGALLTAFFSMVGGLRAVRGSSSNFGREAASALVEAQRSGHDIGITPDGPRGPCYELKAGAVIVPRRTGAPVILVGGEFEAAWRLNSWDHFYLPKPFSRVRLRCELIEHDQLDQKLEDNRAGRLTERERPTVIRDAFHASAFIPTQASTLAADVKRITETDIDMRGDSGDNRRRLHLGGRHRRRLADDLRGFFRRGERFCDFGCFFHVFSS
jgi:lysophospholipid acyltransferase (LPLAT)-like uncharacterized protein